MIRKFLQLSEFVRLVSSPLLKESVYLYETVFTRTVYTFSSKLYYFITFIINVQCILTNSSVLSVSLSSNNTEVLSQSTEQKQRLETVNKCSQSV